MTEPPKDAGLRFKKAVLRVRHPDALASWIVTRYDDVRKVLGDSQLFSSQIPLMNAPPELDIFIQTDPPDHTRIRRLLTPHLTVRRMVEHAQQIDLLVDHALDRLISAGAGADLTEQFSNPLAHAALCQFLGLQATDRALLDQWLHTFEAPDAPLADKQRAGKDMMRYLEHAVRASTAPEGSLLSRLHRRNEEETESLTERELVCVLFTLLSAGYETLRNMISLSLLTLMLRPETADELRADHSLVPAAVEEFARYYSVVHRPLPRKATRDTEIGGVQVKAGEYVAVSLPAANWDTSVFENPEELDIHRTAAPHLAFGHGIHHCVGRPLAVSVLKSVITKTQQRIPQLQPAGNQAPQYLHERLFYGVRELSFEWN
ncbi:cytochrome P450 [Streptomyces sp. NPDC020490]|uniref:cytochrome P450 n=1 Tax=Streptomyces sp. NPDC020490 TaxID=3365078 RepID=UPI00379AE9C7